MKILLGIIFFLIPFPVFLDADFENFSLFLRRAYTQEDIFSIAPIIPVPLNVLLLIIYIIITMFDNSKDKFIKIHFYHFYERLFVLIFIGIALLIFGMNITRLIQLFLPLFFLSSISFIRNKKYVIISTKAYMYGVSSWIFFHFLSIFINNNFSFANVDPYTNFSCFFNFVIYQSLVSYSATLAIFALFMIWVFFWKWQSYKYNLFGIIFFFFTVALAGYSARRVILFDIFILLSMTIILLSASLKFGRVWKVFLIFICFFLIIIFKEYIIDTFYHDTLYRVEIAGAEDRIKLQKVALDEILSNPFRFLFFGTGQLHSYAHNFFLNTILGIGLIFSFLIFYIIYYFAKPFIFYNQKVHNSQSFYIQVFIYGLMLMLFNNSIFNSAITQPIYTANFFSVLVLICSNAKYRISNMEI